MKKSTISLKGLLFFAVVLSALISGIIFIVASVQSNLVLQLGAVTLLYVTAIIYCWLDLKYYIIHFMFLLMIGIFLFNRPIIYYMNNGILQEYSKDTYQFSFTAIAISIVAIIIGGMIGRWIATRNPKTVAKPVNQRFIDKLQRVSFIAFLFTYPFYVLRLVERYMFRRQTTYYGYYANFQSKLPYFTYLLSAFMFFALCTYLATKPSKKKSLFVLLLYIGANAIHLLIGTRNPFILAIVFSFVYFFMRHYTDKNEKWIGRFEKFLLGVGTPVLMLAMGALNYIRDGASVKGTSISGLLVDFLYKQSTSFGALSKGFLYHSALPTREFRNFTFGPIIEYFTRGSLGNTLLGTTPFANTSNSLELALESNSFAHNISYIAMNKDYLEGHGIGSSYIIEVFTDYGFIGLIIANLLLGMLFVSLVNSMYTGKTLRVILSLVILGNLFFMPRSSFTESFYSLFTMQFWFFIAVLFIVSGLLVKRVGYYSHTKDGYINV